MENEKGSLFGRGIFPYILIGILLWILDGILFYYMCWLCLDLNYKHSKLFELLHVASFWGLLVIPGLTALFILMFKCKGERSERGQ